MIAATRWLHVRRITGYVLLMFTAFVISWLVLLAMVRSSSDNNRPTLITNVEVHSLDALWGVDLLTVPIIAAAIAVLRRSRRMVGEIAIALVIGLAIAIGMAYFPSAVMGGHIRWPFRSTHVDTSGYIDLALTYAVSVGVILLIVSRVAARTAMAASDTLTTL
jgi:hypothetical protein